MAYQYAHLIIPRQAPGVPGFRLLQPHVINPSPSAGVGHNVIMVTCRHIVTPSTQLSQLAAHMLSMQNKNEASYTCCVCSSPGIIHR
jgi:hypothetical protein